MPHRRSHEGAGGAGAPPGRQKFFEAFLLDEAKMEAEFGEVHPRR